MIKHIAIIPDGNRRWAKRKGVPFDEGHRIGVETTEKIFEKSLELKEEVNFLIVLINDEFQKLLDDARVRENEVKVRILGRFREVLPKRSLRIIEKLMKKTENYGIFSLTFLLAYNGTDEMIEAVKRISKETKKSAIRMSGDLIKSFLWTKDLPPVDLIIRTGCEEDPHNSAGFMMWQTAYSQYYFTKTLFPDFTTQEFEKAVNNFLKRKRRFGK
jgi:undecaprenyl diphosphate synthase